MSLLWEFLSDLHNKSILHTLNTFNFILLGIRLGFRVSLLTLTSYTSKNIHSISVSFTNGSGGTNVELQYHFSNIVHCWLA